MANHFYRLRMGRYAETLFRRSQRDLEQRLWLQYNLMRLGNELARAKHRSGLADQPVRHGHNATETVLS
ncbi:hypothetical protein Q2941_12130 [Bradyrhizobium sp. UFLA05-153]